MANKVEVVTKEFNECVQKVAKAAGNNQAFPITECIVLSFSDGRVELGATDRMNLLKTTCTITQGTQESFTLSVDSILFSKLIGKITTDKMHIETSHKDKDHTVIITAGEGKYVLPLRTMDDGSPITLPSLPKVNAEFEKISGTVLDLIYKYNRLSIRTDLNYPQYSGYYVDNGGVVTFDSLTACINKNIFHDAPIYVSAATVNLFPAFSEETVDKAVSGSTLLLKTDKTMLMSLLPNQYLSKFPITALRNLDQQSDRNTCSVSKQALSGIIDRLMLFVDERVEFTLGICFGADGISLSCPETDIVELLPYESSSIEINRECYVKIQHLKNAVSSRDGSSITFKFGMEDGLNIQGDNITQHIPYLVVED